MKFTTHNGYFTVTRGHVYLPENVEREDYIETCGRTCEVSVILDENNAVLHKCSVPPALYQEIKFPTDLSLLGSSVLVATIPYSYVSVVICVLNNIDDVYDFEEGVKKWSFEDSEGGFNIDASLNDGTFLFNMQGSGTRTLMFNINGDEGAITEFNTNGDIQFTVDKNMNIKTYGTANIEVDSEEKRTSIGIAPEQIHIESKEVEGEQVSSITMTDSSLNIKVGENVSVEITNEKCVVKTGESVIEMTEDGMAFSKGGSNLKNTLNQLLSAILQLTVTTGVGPSGTPINAASFTQIQQDLDNYLI